MKRQQGLDFVNTLDSKHQSLQPLLRKFVRGEVVTEDELKTAEDNDSRAGQVIAALARLNRGYAAALDELDSFGEPLRPLLQALVEGLSD